AADQTLKGKAHSLHVDVLAVVAHRAAHVHEHDRRAFGVVARAVNLDIVWLEPNRQPRPRSQHRVHQRGGDIHIGDGIAEPVRLRGLKFYGPFTEDRAGVSSRASSLQLAENLFEQTALEQTKSFGAEVVA